MRRFKEFFPEKYRAKINFTVIILIVILYLFLFVFPKVKEVFPNLSKGFELKKQIVDIEKQWKNIEALKQKVAQLKEKKASYDKILPSEKEIPAILEYLSSAAKQLHVRISEIKPLEQEKDKSRINLSLYYRVPILVEAECGYHALGRFINRLESADRFMKISDIKIFSKPNDARMHKAQLLIVTYGMRK